jgi:hypothetical protein
MRQNFVKTESCRPKKNFMEYRELFAKFHKIVFPTFVYFHESYGNSPNIRQHLTVFPSDFNNIYLKYFVILHNLTRDYKIL